MSDRLGYSADRPHLKESLAVAVSESKSKPPVKGTYQHYKGAFYEVLGIAEDPETGHRFVVYQAIGITENLMEKQMKKTRVAEPS